MKVKPSVFVFPHAGDRTVENELFLAAWVVWFERFSPSTDYVQGCMPRLNTKVSLEAQLASGRQFSLDVLLRMLVVPAYRNTMHATSPTLQENLHLLLRRQVVNPQTNRQVNGVCLTDAAKSYLGTLMQQPSFIAHKNHVEARLEADIEVGRDEIQILEVALVEPHPEKEDQGRHLEIFSKIDGQSQLVTQLVNSIATSPSYRCYRKRQIDSEPLIGWSNRLQGYFWPSPGKGYQQTQQDLTELEQVAKKLAGELEHGEWSDCSKEQAIKFANDVFDWGGVPQNPFAAETVADVFRSAIVGSRVNNAPMNSGWTKVAAFASAHLSEDRHLVIWDSRVAHSLIKRIESMLLQTGHQNIPQYLNDIGKVPGRGGSRSNVNYALQWPSGYQRWQAVFAGSALVRAIRDYLNAQKITPHADDASVLWTARMVEMVLFMDGY